MITRGLRFIAPFVARTSVCRGFGTLPEHESLKMPALSPTMTEGTIVKWLKKEGDKVKAGEIMFEVETDKATVGYEVQDDIYIAKILAPEGATKIPLGQPVAILVSKADRLAAFKDYSSSDSAPAAPSSAPAPKNPPAAVPVHSDSPNHTHVSPGPSSSPSPSPSPSASPSASSSSSPSDGTRKFISPIAKVTAKEHSIDYHSLAGSGPNGRVVKADVLAALSTKAAAVPPPAAVSSPPAEDRAGYRDLPHSGVRRTTAARLLESKQKIPHFYLTVDCAVDKLMGLRKLLNAVSDTKISVNDLVIKAAALALTQVPEVNSTWTEEAIRTYTAVDISMAVQTPKGLITPIIKNAHVKRIGEIAKEAKELAAVAKEGRLKPEQFIGGTFTISNLGMFGVKEFSAIINPPQAAILAVGASEGRVVASAETFRVENFMTVTMSCDHRVVDGAVGARWIKVFKGYIEEPYTMLL